MQSTTHGTNISHCEVTNISIHGLWLLTEQSEYFLPFDKFPWFKDSPIRSIQNIERVSDSHFYWPDLDIDLSLPIIENPDNYPLQYKS